MCVNSGETPGQLELPLALESIKIDQKELHPALTPCPYCGRANNTHLGGLKAPKDGDLSMCFVCHHVSVFMVDEQTAALSLRITTDLEWEGVKASPEWVQTFARIQDISRAEKISSGLNYR